jgi:hypothetical protein
MLWISVNFVPWLLDEKQMQWYGLMCLGMKPEMIKTLLLGLQKEKKNWVYCYTPETKQKSCHWKTPHSIAKESRLVRLNIKSMLVILVTTGSFAISKGKRPKTSRMV